MNRDGTGQTRLTAYDVYTAEAVLSPDGRRIVFTSLKDGDLDMGPMGKYEFLKVSGGRFALGAVMSKMPEMPVSAWSFYFRVPDIDKGAAAISANGGTILQGPMEIPGGDFSMMALDPAGAAFGLVGARA